MQPKSDKNKQSHAWRGSYRALSYRSLWGALLVVGVLGIATIMVGVDSSAFKLNPLTLSPAIVTIESAKGDHRFTVELADTLEEQQMGLMFRASMPEDHGMLFDFGAVRSATMWMKNTPLPLDMLFIRADGIIHRIEAETEPYSLATIASGGKVLAVLELNGGVAARLGIRAGDRVRHPIFVPR